jgi:hypothetical protein
MKVAVPTGQTLPPTVRVLGSRFTTLDDEAEPPARRHTLRANPTENCEPEYGIPQSVSSGLRREQRARSKLVEVPSEPSETCGKIPVHDTLRALPAHPTPRAYALTRQWSALRLDGAGAP